MDSNFIKGQPWQIRLKISKNQKEASISLESFLEGKQINHIFVAQDEKDEQGQELTSTGFFLSLYYGGRQQNILPASMLRFDNPNIIYLETKDIVWNQSKVSLAEPASEEIHIQLIVFYEDT